jgi:hypothetical protein
VKKLLAGTLSTSKTGSQKKRLSNKGGSMEKENVIFEDQETGELLRSYPERSSIIEVTIIEDKDTGEVLEVIKEEIFRSQYE